MHVEVAYAGPEGQWLLALTLADGARAQDALDASGLARQLGAERLASLRLGINSKVVAPTVVLREGDRVELYRALVLDPKSARRRRAQVTRAS